MNTTRCGGAGWVGLLLALVAPAWAQVELVAINGDTVTVVTDVNGGAPFAAGKPVTGELRFRPAAEFARADVEVALAYSVKPAAASAGEMLDVPYDVFVDAHEPMEGLYYAVGWESHDGAKIAALRNVHLGDRNSGHRNGVVNVPASERDGFLRLYLFRDGKQLGGTSKKEREFVPLLDAIGRGDRQAVIGWANAHAERAKVPFWILERLAAWGDVPSMEAVLRGVNESRIKSRDAGAAVIAAAAAGRPRMVALLLRQGAPPDVVQESGATPLCMAAAAHQLESMEALIAAGAKVNRWSGKAFTISNPLEAAIKSGSDLEPAELLLRHGAKWPGRKDLNKWLVFTVIWRPAEISRRLLVEGADPNYKALGSPLLVKAAMRPDGDLIGDFLRAGAKVDALDENGRTALTYVAQRGDIKSVRLLKQAGASLTAVDKEKNVAATWAIIGGHPELVEELLPSEGLAMDVLSQLLARAVLLPSPELVTTLVQRGAYLLPGAADLDGALVVAIQSGNIDLLRGAIAHGLDANYHVYKAWPLGAVAKRYQQEAVLAVLADAKGDALDTQTPPVVKSPMQVVTRGRGIFPPELAARELFGDAKIEVYVSPEGTPVLPQLRAASSDVVGRAALQALAELHFNALEPTRGGWRRVVVPIVYSRENMAGGEIYDEMTLDARPALQESASDNLQEDNARQLAWLAFTVDKSGRVVAPRVLSVTPGAEEAALETARGWKFRPGIRGGEPVWAKTHAFLVLPAGRVIDQERVFIPDGVGVGRTKPLRLVNWPAYPADLSATVQGPGPVIQTIYVKGEITKPKQRWAVLLRLTLDDFGNVSHVNVAAATDPSIGVKVQRVWRNVMFEPFQRDGRSVPVTGWYLEVSGSGIDEPVNLR